MRILLLCLFLSPFFASGQILHATYSYDKTLGNGYGGGIAAGGQVYKNTFVGASVDVVKYEGLDKKIVPVSLTVYYDEKTAKRIGFMSQAQVGWNFGGGWFYSGYFIGAKVASGNFHPFLLLGVMKPHFKTGKVFSDFSPLTLKTGISF